jgi:hypothetical protein
MMPYFVKLRLLPPKGTFRNKVASRKLLLVSFFVKLRLLPPKGTFRHKVAPREL